ncbi:prolyl oligopeptidase [Suillus decipiens]|nr:prolyl oligopeptidase [Suillus decipiens]
MTSSAAENKSILTPVITLEGHEPHIIYSPDHENHNEHRYISSISYFPDGKQMISGSRNNTIRRWDLREGKGIEKVREVCENRIEVRVSRDGRWVVTAGRKELKVTEVETGVVRTFHHEAPQVDRLHRYFRGQRFTSERVDRFYSADMELGHRQTRGCLLASTSFDCTIKLWAFESHQLLASFDIKSPMILVLSPDSRHLAYTTLDDTKIYICNVPANILANIGLAEELQRTSSTSKPKRSRLAVPLDEIEEAREVAKIRIAQGHWVETGIVRTLHEDPWIDYITDTTTFTEGSQDLTLPRTVLDLRTNAFARTTVHSALQSAEPS